MRLTLSCLVLGLVAVAAAPPARAADVNLNVYPLALRSLGDDDLWTPVEDQLALGGMVDFGGRDWPIHLVLGEQVSLGVEEFGGTLFGDVTGSIAELSFGISKTWETRGRTRPFLSAGLSLVAATLEVENLFAGTTQEEDDTSAGVWIEGGVYWRLGPHFNLGLHGRILGGTALDLLGVETDADYWQLGPMIGWSWPPRS
ncbi:MAG: hypothetical protein ACRD5D_09880 [Candidatus Polarisedimenticolia bacterium]